MSILHVPSTASALRVGTTAALALSLAGLAGVAGAGLPNTVELPAYRFEAPAREVLGPALAERVILVVVDGLGADHFNEIVVPGALREALRRGAFFTSIVEPPSWSRTQYATLGTGAGVLVHGIASNAQSRALTIDSIFKRAEAAGIARVLFKPKIEWWLEEFGEAVGVHTKDFKEALAAVRRETRVFATFHFIEVDDMGHDHGGASRLYRAAIAETGRRIGEILGVLDLSRDLLILTADHGHTARGGHGGDEPVVSRTPLVLIGAKVRPGDYGESRPHDVAPTAAMALGVGAPRASLGRPLTAAFEMDETERWRRDLAARDGVRRFVERWAREVGAVTPVDASVDATLSMVRNHLLQRARARMTERLVVALLSFLALTVLLDPRRLFSVKAVLIALCGLGAASAIYLASGLPATFSAVRERGDFVVVGILIATGAVGVQAVIWRGISHGSSSSDRLLSLFSVATATIWLAGAVVAVVFAAQGFSIADVYPSPTTIFCSILALSLSAGIALYWGIVLLAARAASRACG